MNVETESDRCYQMTVVIVVLFLIVYHLGWGMNLPLLLL